MFVEAEFLLRFWQPWHELTYFRLFIFHSNLSWPTKIDCGFILEKKTQEKKNEIEIEFMPTFLLKLYAKEMLLNLVQIGKEIKYLQVYCYSTGMTQKLNH